VTGGAAPKRKGSTFERDLVAYLRANGFPAAERTYGAGRPDDVGDIDGVPDFTIEAKAHRAIDLAAFADEAETERVNAGRRFAAVIAKRRNKATSAAYVIVTLEQFVRLIHGDEVSS
jgi:Holliday junction resolvase